MNKAILREWAREQLLMQAFADESVNEDELVYIQHKYNFMRDYLLKGAGSFLFTKDKEKFDIHRCQLCCNIVEQTFIVEGEEIYYAMHHGH